MKRIFVLIPLFLLILSLTACQGQGNVTDPNPVIPETVVVEEPTVTSTPEAAENTTPEPTLFDDSDETLQTWTGTIESLPPGGQFNDQFTSDSLETGACGIDGNSDEVNQLISQVRDSGKLVSLQGVLFEDVPDVYGCQIRVTALEEE